MEFHDEIAATGELSDIGLPLRRNVDRSNRRGIEISESWQITSALRLEGNANFSRNRIHRWTQFYDVYDAGGNVVGSRPVDYFDVNPLLTPALLVNQAIDFTPVPRVTLGAAGRWASRSYLDNTNNDAFVTPSFFVVDANLSVGLWHAARLMLQVNNVFDNRRVFPSGYSYEFFTPAGTLDGISYFYPQATRNVVLTLRAGL